MLGSYANPKGALSPGSGGSVGSWSTNVRYEDMNASTGGVARGTSIGSTYTSVYSRTGEGLLIGFVLTLENTFDEWQVRLTVDGTEIIFEVNTKDLIDNNTYGYDAGGGDDELTTFLGFNVHDKTFRWQGPLNIPVSYSSSVKVEVRYIKGGSKAFRGGLVARTL